MARHPQGAHRCCCRATFPPFALVVMWRTMASANIGRLLDDRIVPARCICCILSYFIIKREIPPKMLSAESNGRTFSGVFCPFSCTSGWDFSTKCLRESLFMCVCVSGVYSGAPLVPAPRFPPLSIDCLRGVFGSLSG